MTKQIVKKEVASTLREMLDAILKQHDGFLDVTEVCRRTTLSRSRIFEMEQAGEFPARRQIGRQKVGWLASEVSEWIASRPTVDDAREAREAATRS